MEIVLKQRARISARGTSLWPPIVAGDSIYVSHPDFTIERRDRRTLNPIWVRASEGRIPHRLESDRLLYFSREGKVGALFPETGDTAWEQDKPNAALHSWNGQLVIAARDTLRFLDPGTGAVIEEVGLSSPLLPTRLCRDVLVGRTPESGDPIRAYSLVDRRVIWERPLQQEMRDRFGVSASDPVMEIASSPNGFIATRAGSTFGCSLEDGRILWHVAAAARLGRLNIVDGRVILYALGRLMIIDEATGAIVADVRHAAFSLDFSFGPGAVIGGDLIVFATGIGLIGAFRLADGALVAQRQFKVGFEPAVAAGDDVVVPDHNGELLILRVED